MEAEPGLAITGTGTAGRSGRSVLMRSVGGWGRISRIISGWFRINYATTHVKSVIQLFLPATNQSNMPCPECAKKCKMETL